MRLSGASFMPQSSHVLLHTVFTDITTEIAAQRQRDADLYAVRFHARHDALTGIYNRETFFEETARYLAAHADTRFVLVRWDIARFKLINELFGQSMGDSVLCEVANLLKKVNGYGTFGRLEADNFVTVFPYKYLDTDQLANCVKHCFNKFQLNYEISLYAGIYVVEDITLPVNQMCDRALLALRSVKGSYLNHVAFCDDNLREAMLLEQEILSEMDDALATGQFKLYFHPLYSVSTEQPVGAEALTRWHHPQKGMLSPAVFIPLFERNGFIVKLDNWAWENTCKFLAQNIAEGKKVVPISVNVSRMNLFTPTLVDDITNLTEKYHLPRKLLKLEITESAYAGSPHQLLEVVRELRRRGFQVLMDDFGSGYSSLHMLKDLPVDVLKIDMKFISDLELSSRAGSVMNSVIRMAKWLEMSVVAEGVETKAQLDYLRSIGCNSVQGYYFAKPLPEAEFVTLLQNSVGEAELPQRPNAEITDEDFSMLFSAEGSNLQKLYDSLGAFGIYELNGTTLEMLRINDQYRALTGTDINRRSGDTLNALNWVHADDRALVLNLCREADRTRKPQTATVRRYHADGRLLWLSLHIQSLSAKGNNTLFYILLTPMSEQNEAPVKHTLCYFSKVLRSLYSLIFEMDYEANTAYALHYTNGGDLAGADLTLPQAIKMLEASLQPEDRAAFTCLRNEHLLQAALQQAATGVLHLQGRLLTLRRGYEMVRVSVFPSSATDGEHSYLFCFSLANAAAALPQPESTESTAALTAASGTVLIVDDSAVNRTLLEKVLSSKYRVLKAENGLQALQLLAQHHEVGVILLDLLMPVMDGYAFLQHRANDERLRTIPAVVLSMADSLDSEEKARALGANEFLRKPYEPRLILQRVGNLLQLRKISADHNAVNAILNNLPAGIIVYHINGSQNMQATYVNGGIRGMSGLTVEEHLQRYGQNCLQSVHLDDRAYVAAAVDAALAARTGFAVEYRHLRTGGQPPLWMRLEAAFAFMDGDAGVYYAVLADITTAKQQAARLDEQQQELNDAYAKLQIAFDQSDLYMWEYNLQTQVLHFPPRVQNALHFPSEIDLRQPLPALLVNDAANLPILQQIGPRLLSGESPVEIVLHLQFSSVTDAYIKIVYHTHTSGNLPPHTAIGVGRDITEEVRALQLSQQEAAYRRSLIKNAVAFAEYDLEDGHLVDFDPNTLCVLGITEQDSFAHMLVHVQQTLLFAEDRELFTFEWDCAALRAQLALGHSELYVECRQKAENSAWEGYHWIGTSFTYLEIPSTHHLHMYVCMQDIHTQKQAEISLKMKAQRDALTHLLNRAAFTEFVNAFLSADSRQSLCAFYMLDIDDFKSMNDTYGHAYGDEVLQLIAQRLRAMFRQDDYVGRLGGDEMVVFMTNVPSLHLALAKGEEICRTLASISPTNDRLPVTCSVGLSLAPQHGTSFDNLYHKADSALYKAKQQGKNRCCQYQELP